MRLLRLIFAWCFAAATVLCLWEARTILPANVTVAEPGFASAPILKALLIAVSLALAVLFGIAWWRVLKEKAAAGKWAIAASLATVLFGFLLMSGQPFRILNPAWIAIAFGLAGASVFSRRTAVASPTAKPRSYAPLPGDGTTKLGNKLILVAGIAGGIGGVRLFTMWARSHGLPRGFPPFYVLQVVLAILLVLAIHEAGHALAGMALRMKLIGILVGPFHWVKPYGRWKFNFRGAGMLAFAGQTMVAPITMENFRNRKVLQVAAGPLASLLAGGAAAAAVLTAPGRPWAGEWGPLAVFADITTLVGLLNLVPFGNKSMYSDGAKLYQLLAGGLWTRYHRALGMVSSTVVTSLRPRDYDIATFEQAAGRIATGRDEAFLHLCSYAYYLDRRQLAEAAREIEKAESLCREWAIEPPTDWCSIFVLADAILRRDAVAARRWWDRMESRKSFRFTDNLWDARCALLWSENRLDEAGEAWKKADAWARQLPNTGAGETERNAVRVLREALDESIAKSAAQSLAVSAE
jgi:hypothetical protein